jgi:regulator of sigma E protease
VSGRILDFVQTGFVFLLMGFFLFVSFKDVGDFFKPSDAEKELPAPVFAAVAGSISSGTASVSQD